MLGVPGVAASPMGLRARLAGLDPRLPGGPPVLSGALPSSVLELERRLIRIRWVGIAAVIPALALAHLGPHRALEAGLVLVLAVAYNLAVLLALARGPGLLRGGYATSAADALLSVMMLLLIGGFDSPFNALLFTVAISVAMRYGYGPAAVLSSLFVGMDAATGLAWGRADWAPFLVRSGFLVITTLLVGYLRQQAARAEVALAERLRRARRFDDACHLLGATLEAPAMRVAVGRAFALLLDAADVRVLARGEPVPLGPAPDLTLDLVPESPPGAAPLGQALVWARSGAGPADTDAALRLAERATLALEKCALYEELAARYAQLQVQADGDPLTGLLNYRALLQRVDAHMAAGEAGALVLLDIDNFKSVNDSYGHPVGDGLLRAAARVLERACPPGALVGRYGGDEFVVFCPGMGEAGAAPLARGIRAAARLVSPPGPDGQGIPLSFSVGTACLPGQGPGIRQLLEAADEAMYRDKRGDEGAAGLGLAYLRSDPNFAVLESMVLAVDRKDRYTRDHSLDVTRLALLLAAALGLPEADLRALSFAGPLHDVGKIAVADAILRKPGRLTREEYLSVQAHVAYGIAFIRGVLPGAEMVLEAVQHHHERWDGAGYPAGVPGERTPVLGRVMQVADAASAMMLDRPYRRGMPWVAVAVELRSGAGRQFDPSLIEPFIAAVEAAAPEQGRIFQASALPACVLAPVP